MSSVAKTEQKTQLSAPEQYRARVGGYVSSFLTKILPPERLEEVTGRFDISFRACALSVPGLYSAEPQSIGNAIAMSCLSNLMPGGLFPQCYIIPRREKVKGTNDYIQGIQWMASWRGLQTLAKRAGYTVVATPVFLGDEFELIRGLSPDIIHQSDPDAAPEWENLRGVYVIATEDATGNTRFEWLNRASIEARRNKSDSWKAHIEKGWQSPWKDWPIEQALKTAIRYAISRGLVVLDSACNEMLKAEGEDDAITVDAQPQITNAPKQAVPALAGRKRGGLEELEMELAPQHETEQEDAEPEPAPRGRKQTTKKDAPNDATDFLKLTINIKQTTDLNKLDKLTEEIGEGAWDITPEETEKAKKLIAERTAALERE